MKAFLRSPMGGLWHENEIETLRSPALTVLRGKIETLKWNDYSFISFAGHGFYSNQRRSTIVQLNAHETLDSLDLRIGATKHTLILDCCRKREDETRILKATFEGFAMDAAKRQSLNPRECREFFDKTISNCATGLVVMNACSIDETAGEQKASGGYYTSSLLDVAYEWADKRLHDTNLSQNYRTLSTQSCHDQAAKRVEQLSGGRQTPSFDGPRVEKKFPFAIVA